MKYRKKPVVVEAYKYNGDGTAALDWAGSVVLGGSCKIFVRLTGDKKRCGLFIDTLEGEMHVSEGDFIILGVAGEFYPCKPDIFEKTYEKVEE